MNKLILTKTIGDRDTQHMRDKMKGKRMQRTVKMAAMLRCQRGCLCHVLLYLITHDHIYLELRKRGREGGREGERVRGREGKGEGG